MGDFNRDEYNEGQLHWIDIGLKEQHDILKYIDPFYTAGEIREILFGLEDGLDVSIYAEPKGPIYTGSKFDMYQMREIRVGLKKEVDVSKYADPKFSDDQMCEIRQGGAKNI